MSTRTVTLFPYTPLFRSCAVGFVLFIAKAYTTRVGSVPFLTVLDDATGTRLGERGHEFGTVTGRKRRCGWFDAVLVRQSAAVSGVTGIARSEARRGGEACGSTVKSRG